MMKVTANGKTFTFPDGTSTEDIGTAIDEYFAGQAVQQKTVNQDNNAPTREEPSLMQQAGDWLTGGQSAGQIAEQAGRGLVNIPFDVLQGGASLINAISQGLGGPKVLDDVYRPVDRPTDPYAQAGETIGGYLVPGVGTAGSMAIGSLAEAANQKGDFAQNAAKNAGVNLAAQGVLSAAAKGIGRGITAIKGDIAPEVAKKIAIAPSKRIIDRPYFVVSGTIVMLLRNGEFSRSHLQNNRCPCSAYSPRNPGSYTAWHSTTLCQKLRTSCTPTSISPS